MTRDGGMIRFSKAEVYESFFPRREQENGFLKVFW